jgi:spermidine synthase
VISRTRLIPPEKIGLLTFAGIEIGIGLSVFLLIPLFSRLPYVMLRAFYINADSYRFITFYQFLLSLMIVIVPTALMGATLPVIGKIVSREVTSLGRSIGNIYFFNTFGAIFGAFFAGFLFVPYLGTLSTLKLGIGVNILLGLGALLLSTRGRKRGWVPGVLVLFSVAGLFGIVTADWDPRLMDSGVAIYGNKIASTEGRDKLKVGSRILSLQEGINATITVRKGEDEIALLINGKTDASTAGSDMATQLLLGHLPVMLHPDPQSALVIGLGSGVTARAAAQHDTIQSMDVVEIEPSLRKTLEFFNDVNHHVGDSPKTNLIINDGRNHLLETEKTYDIIVSEPSNPWISGIASLYTTDFYTIAREKLNQNGIFCQWIHSYSMSMGNLAMVLGTLSSSFEDVQLWTSGVGDLLVIASTGRITVDPGRVDRVVNLDLSTAEEFRTFLMVREPMEVLGRLLLDRSGIIALSKGARTNSDNYPYLEFHAPRDIYRNDTATIYMTILNVGDDMVPGPLDPSRDRRAAALGLYHRSKVFDVSQELSEQYIRRALALDDSDGDFYLRLGKIMLDREQYGAAEEAVARGLTMEKSSGGLRLLADVMIGTGRREEALSLLERNKDAVEGYEDLYGDILFEGGHYPGAIPYLEKSLALGQGKEYLTLEKLGRCHDEIGGWETAADYYRLSIEKEEMNSRTHSLLGEVYWKQGKYEEAAGIFQFLADHWDVKRHIYERLADCYIRLNQAEQAEFILKKILPGFDT